MKNLIYFLVIAFLLSEKCSAHSLNVDARSLSMAGSTISLAGNELFQNNIALAAFRQKSFVQLSAINKYYIKELSPVFLNTGKSVNENTFVEAGIGRTGSNEFSREFFHAGIAKKLGQKYFAGLRFDYRKWIINDSKYHNTGTLIPSFYLFANAFKTLCFGVCISNPARLKKQTNESQEREIDSGISFIVSDKIAFAFSSSLRNKEDINFHFGTEYQIYKILILRAGINSQPLSQSFGFGLHVQRFIVDIGLETNSVLNNTTALSLSFPL